MILDYLHAMLLEVLLFLWNHNIAIQIYYTVGYDAKLQVACVI